MSAFIKVYYLIRMFTWQYILKFLFYRFRMEYTLQLINSKNGQLKMDIAITNLGMYKKLQLIIRL